jgi:hypothetical protein
MNAVARRAVVSVAGCGATLLVSIAVLHTARKTNGTPAGWESSPARQSAQERHGDHTR